MINNFTVEAIRMRRRRNRVDREPADSIKKHLKYFEVERPDGTIYHTMLNTEIGNQAVVPVILSSTQTYEARGAA